MKKLVIGFSRPKGRFMILSDIIRYIQGTPYSHVFFKIENDNLRNHLFYHAKGSVVNFMGTTLFFKKNIPIKTFEFEIDEQAFYKFLDAAIDRVGVKYSPLQLVGFLVAKLFKLKKNPFGKKGYVCSELVAEVLKEVRNFTFDKDLNLVDLKDIYNLLSNENNRI